VGKRRGGGGFVFGLIIVGTIVSVFSDDKSSTSTPSEKASSPRTEQPSINLPMGTSVKRRDSSSSREVSVSERDATTPTQKEVQQPDLFASVKTSLEAEKTAATLSSKPIRVVYSSAKLRMRRGPGTTYPAIVTLEKGTRLEVFATDGEWLQVTASPQSGWVHGSFVADGNITVEKRPIKHESVPARRLVRTTPENRSGQPIRDAYVGTCDCPYDLMSNGRRCGGRSAYSRPGGRSPQCYF
jgi:uncharacterized protein YraI